MLCGDAELQEGSIWEAMWLAAFHELDNLMVLVDDNQIGSVTRTKNVADTSRILPALEALGCTLETVDGHDISEIVGEIDARYLGHLPRIIHCQTVKGQGVSFMRGDPNYHYRPLNDETYAQAMAEQA